VDLSLLDDNMGEALGDGLDASADGLSGTDAMTLDFLGEEPLQGSNIALDFSDGAASNASVTDFSGFDDPFAHDTSLSGVSDPPPHPTLDSGSSLNGAGTAASQYSPASSELGGVDELFSSVGKFGASLGALILHSGPSHAMVGAPVPGVNPNKSSFTSISGGHVTLLLVVVVILAGVVVFGDN
jgi:hypothetical protein